MRTMIEGVTFGDDTMIEGLRMIEGVTIKMAGREWVVPPLTLAQYHRYIREVAKLRELDPAMAMTEAQIEVVVALVSAAMHRNYPDLTPEAVEDMLDFGNLSEVLLAIFSKKPPPAGVTGAMPQAPMIATLPKVTH